MHLGVARDVTRGAGRLHRGDPQRRCRPCRPRPPLTHSPVRLDPLPTQRATTAIAELCEYLTATETRYPGTDLVLRYEVKTRP